MYTAYITKEFLQTTYNKIKHYINLAHAKPQNVIVTMETMEILL